MVCAGSLLSGTVVAVECVDSCRRRALELVDAAGAEAGLPPVPDWADDRTLLFDELGFDSFDAVDVVLTLEDLLGTIISEVELADVWTVGDLLDLVVRYMPSDS